MKPPGGNYKPDRMTIQKIPNRMSGAVADDAEGNDTPGVAEVNTAKVLTASPAELILMMYEQFFELIPDIKRNIQRKSAAATEPDSERAQAIIEEFINSLDFDVELSKDLGAIYFYVRNLILEANIRFDVAIWDEIESVMRPLYEGFKEASRQLEPISADSVISSSNPSIFAGITYGQNSLKEIVVNTKNGLRV